MQSQRLAAPIESKRQRLESLCQELAAKNLNQFGWTLRGSDAARIRFAIGGGRGAAPSRPALPAEDRVPGNWRAAHRAARAGRAVAVARLRGPRPLGRAPRPRTGRAPPAPAGPVRLVCCPRPSSLRPGDAAPPSALPPPPASPRRACAHSSALMNSLSIALVLAHLALRSKPPRIRRALTRIGLEGFDALDLARQGTGCDRIGQRPDIGLALQTPRAARARRRRSAARRSASPSASLQAAAGPSADRRSGRAGR